MVTLMSRYVPSRLVSLVEMRIWRGHLFISQWDYLKTRLLLEFFYISQNAGEFLFCRQVELVL